MAHNPAALIEDRAIHSSGSGIGEEPGSDSIPEEQALVRKVFRYFKNRKKPVFYDEGKSDLPIGSGIVESGHKHVLENRMKQSGIA